MTHTNDIEGILAGFDEVFLREMYKDDGYSEEREALKKYLTTALTSYGEKRFQEGKQRRENELMIMLDEVEREGWTMTRFVNTFAALNMRNQEALKDTVVKDV